MGSAGDKPRKRRFKEPKVPRGAEANNIHLAGLSNDSTVGGESHRLDHEKAHGRSDTMNGFQRGFLRMLGRKPKHPELETDAEESTD
jgi:hypothetical protein